MTKPMLLKRGMRCTFGGCRKRATKAVCVSLTGLGKLWRRPACERCAVLFGPFYNGFVVDFDALLRELEARR